MGCFSFLADILGISAVSRGAKSRPGMTFGLLALFWLWAFGEGAMIVRYAHLGEHPYVFQLMPMASCASPAVAAVAVVLFTLGDALTNIFSQALAHSFGIQPPIDLYAMTGTSQPLLTWGAYIRLNLIGLMCYALLPGILGRLFSHLVRGITGKLFSAKRPPAAAVADGPKDGEDVLGNEGPDGDGNPETIETSWRDATTRDGEILINEGPDGDGILDGPGTVEGAPQIPPLREGIGTLGPSNGNHLGAVVEGGAANAGVLREGLGYAPAMSGMTATPRGLVSRGLGSRLVRIVPRSPKPPPANLSALRAQIAQQVRSNRGTLGPRHGRSSIPMGPSRDAFGRHILPPHLGGPLGPGGRGPGGRGPGGRGPRIPWTDHIPSYIGAVLGAASGTIMGGGIYYGDMYTEYHTIRTITMGSPDASCFKMDANYAVDNVIAGGTMAPAAGVAAVVTSGAGAGGSAGGNAGAGAGTGSPTGAGGGAFAGATAGAQAGIGFPGRGPAPSTPGAGQADDDNPWEYADKVVDTIKNAGEAGNARTSDALTSNAQDRLGFDPSNPDAVRDFRNQQQRAAQAHQDAMSGQAGAENRFNDAMNAENAALNDYTNAQTQSADAQAHADTLRTEIDNIRSTLASTTDPAQAQALSDRLSAAQSDLDGWRTQQGRADYVAADAGQRWADTADARAAAGDDLTTAMDNTGQARQDMDGLRGQDDILSQHNRGQQDLDATNNRLGQLALIANILLDATKYNNADGMSAFEALTAGTGANLAANAATESFGTADFAAGVFFPTSMQGLVPSNAVKDAVQTTMEAYTSFWQYAGGDDQAFDRFGQRAADGKTGWIASGYAELAQAAGTLWEAPADSIRDFANGVQDIWNAGPLSLAGDAINTFAQNALNGGEGPMAQTVADLANASGHLYENPGQTLQEFGADSQAILQHGSPSDLILGQEGSDRAVAILGPIGEGYKGMSELAGEAWEEPGQFASDVKNVTVQGVKDGASYIADTGRGAVNWVRSWF